MFGSSPPSLTSGIGKSSAAAMTASNTVASSSPRVKGRSARIAASVSVRFFNRDSSLALHASIVSGTYRPPSGARPSNRAVLKETGGV